MGKTKTRYIPNLTDEEIKENHKHFIERINLYKKLSLDFVESRKSIFKKVGPLKGKILEIGSGSGYTALSLAKSGYKFISIDNDKEALKKAAANLIHEKLLSNVEFYVMDARKLSFDSMSFQNVIAINLFHHIEEIDKILSEIDRVLYLNGRIVMVDFSKKGMEIINGMHKKEGHMHEDSGVTKDHVSSYYKRLGYRVEDNDDLYHWVLIAEKKICR